MRSHRKRRNWHLAADLQLVWDNVYGRDAFLNLITNAVMEKCRPEFVSKTPILLTKMAYPFQRLFSKRERARGCVWPLYWKRLDNSTFLQICFGFRQYCWWKIRSGALRRGPNINGLALPISLSSCRCLWDAVTNLLKLYYAVIMFSTGIIAQL